MRENSYLEFVDSLKDMLSNKFNCEVGVQKVTGNNGLANPKQKRTLFKL